MVTTKKELKLQWRIAVPLTLMNLTWFARIAITTAFLGRLGELELAGGTLGSTFSNVTGFSVLNGLCTAMEPICGQAYGAKNSKLLHNTLTMAILLLLITTLPISVSWLYVDKILTHFGQEEDISTTAKKYLFYLLPDLVVYSFLCPLKTYLSTKNRTFPIMLCSFLGLAFHVPVNVALSKAKGLEGVAMAVWLSDLVVVIPLVIYVSMTESGKEGGWWNQHFQDWLKFLRLSAPCCLITCLEWWCYELLILLTGRLKGAKQAVGVLAIVLNFDYLLYSVMLSIATCASVRVSNELGANQPSLAQQSSYVSLTTSLVIGSIGGSVMIAFRGIWGSLFSQDKAIIQGVKKMLLIMALIEVVNFPLAVCGGIVRGTARPWLAIYANIGGFYLVAFPLSIVLAFKVGLGVVGVLLGFLVGVIVCLMLLVTFFGRIDWKEESFKAQKRASSVLEVVEDDANHISMETVGNTEDDKESGTQPMSDETIRK